MKEYINRELALKTKVPHYSANGVEIVEGEAIPVEYIEHIPAADVVEAGYKVFAEWVARIIFNGGLEDESFCELACRKLNDLGIVEKTENEWHFDDPCKNITPAYLVETRHKEDTQ